MEPIDGEVDFVGGLLAEAPEFVWVFSVGVEELLPVLIGVVQVPLVAQGHHAFVPRARHHQRLRLVVDVRLVRLHHHFLHFGLRVLHFHPLVFLDHHRPLVKPLQVDLLLGLSEELFVVLALHFELRADFLCGVAAVVGDFDDFDGADIDHVFLDSVLFAQFWLLLQVPEGCEIIGCVGGDTRDYAGSLFHRNGEHREGVDCLQGSQRRFQGGSQQLPPLHLLQLKDPSELRSHVLMRHIQCTAFRADINLLVLHFKRAVDPIREEEAIGLSVHCFRAESGRHQVDCLSLELLDGFREGVVLDPDFYEGVFLRVDAFSFRAFVVRADLLVRDRENGGTLPEADFILE